MCGAAGINGGGAVVPPTPPSSGVNGAHGDMNMPPVDPKVDPKGDPKSGGGPIADATGGASGGGPTATPVQGVANLDMNALMPILQQLAKLLAQLSEMLGSSPVQQAPLTGAVGGGAPTTASALDGRGKYRGG